MSDKATPTITLAELYENQNQYIDALVIYKNLYKKNPTEELQNKIDELKDKIFKENTLEYSAIIDKIFTEEEKRLFHILPHEQYKAYKESQAELKNDETYPEELIEVKEEVTPDDTKKPEIEEELTINEEETLDKENTKETEEEIDTEETKEELIPEIEEELQIDEEETPDIEDTTEIEEIIDTEETKEELVPEEEEVARIDEEETPDIEDTKEELVPEEEETIELEDTLENDDTLEDDISLEIDEDISDDLKKSETITELNTQTEDSNSIEDLVEKKKEAEQNELIDTEETDQSINNENEFDTIVKSHDDNQILSLLTKLSNIRPDIVERVLKENVGSDTSLADIKLSDLNYVVELLKVSENVERE